MTTELTTTSNCSNDRWSSLPNELAVNIISYLCLDDRQLAQISKINSTFKGVITSEYLPPSYSNRYSLTRLGAFKYSGQAILSPDKQIHILSKKYPNNTSIGKSKVEDFTVRYAKYDTPSAVSGFYMPNYKDQTGENNGLFTSSPNGLLLLQKGQISLLNTTESLFNLPRAPLKFSPFEDNSHQTISALEYDPICDNLVFSTDEGIIYVCHNQELQKITSKTGSCVAIHHKNESDENQSFIYCALADKGGKGIAVFRREKSQSESSAWPLVCYLPLPSDISNITCLWKGEKALYIGCDNGEVIVIAPSQLNTKYVQMEVGNRLRWSQSKVTSLREMGDSLYVGYQNTIGIASISGTALQFDGRIDLKDSLTGLERMNTGEIICTTSTGFYRIDNKIDKTLPPPIVKNNQTATTPISNTIPPEEKSVEETPNRAPSFFGKITNFFYSRLRLQRN